MSPESPTPVREDQAAQRRRTTRSGDVQLVCSGQGHESRPAVISSIWAWLLKLNAREVDTCLLFVRRVVADP